MSTTKGRTLVDVENKMEKTKMKGGGYDRSVRVELISELPRLCLLSYELPTFPATTRSGGFSLCLFTLVDRSYSPSRSSLSLNCSLLYYTTLDPLLLFCASRVFLLSVRSLSKDPPHPTQDLSRTMVRYRYSFTKHDSIYVSVDLGSTYSA